MEEAGVARAKKKALKEGRILVFIDESGLSQRPHRCRTWAPRGQTPILQYNFNWKTLSVAAGLTLWNFYFRIYAGAIKKEQVVDFLGGIRHGLANRGREDRNVSATYAVHRMKCQCRPIPLFCSLGNML